MIEFIKESNRIEGILREPTEKEISEYQRFMSLDEQSMVSLETFVKVYQPNAILRGSPLIHGVRVGNHIAPPSGGNILHELSDIVLAANGGGDPFETHMRYETLHPFTDGNGRSGRMLWLWMMKSAPLGFLHTWYYQSLSNARVLKSPDVQGDK